MTTILRIPSSELDTFAAAAIYVNSLKGLSKRERRAMMLQQYREGLVKPQLLGLRKDDHAQRAATAGLSAVGAAAGVGGLAYGLHDMRRARRAGKRIPLKTKALIPLEVAGLGGELMATKILHGDAKRMKEGAVAKSEMSTTGIFERVSKRADGEGRNLLEEELVEKRQRRYDPEADRQRRLGTYAGAGIGGAGILGTAGAVTLRGAEEKHKRTIKVPKLKANRKGYLLAAGGAASGITGLAAYKRGISERNRPWN